MTQDRSPAPGCGGEEPDRSGSPSAAGDGQHGREPWPEDDWDADASIETLVAAIDAGEYEIPPADEEGVFVCLPSLADQDQTGFADGGAATAMGPGPALAALVHAAVGPDGKQLAALSEDELLGVLAAARRLESRIAWTQLVVIGEFATRRAAGPGGHAGTTGPARFAADELAAEMGMTWQSAAGQLAYASQVASRLPRTFAALAAGEIHPVHVRIIDDETQVLSDADAAKADELLAGMAPSKTWARLRYAARRLVLKLDPDAARRRKEAAKRQAHVRRYQEGSGNAGMIARELPSDEVLASWQHIEQRALDLRASGMPGTLQELRVKAFLDLLQERDSRTAPVGPPSGQTTSSASPDSGANPADPTEPAESGGSGPAPQEPAPQESAPQESAPQEPGPDGTSSGRTGLGGNVGRDPGPSLAALVNITIPLEAVLGQDDTPGEINGFGLVDADTARDLVAAAGRDPRTRWCITVLAPDGTAAAHGCAAGRHHPPPPGGMGPPGGTGPSGPAPPGGSAADFLAGLKIKLIPVIRGSCDHAQAEGGYRPSRTLAHLVRARTARCAAPGCNRPAERCDLDHTIAWDKGGRTCPCDLAPLCRHHHRCKQAQGWKLEQPEPGVLKWHTPSGRTYTTTPTIYSM